MSKNLLEYAVAAESSESHHRHMRYVHVMFESLEPGQQQILDQTQCR